MYDHLYEINGNISDFCYHCYIDKRKAANKPCKNGPYKHKITKYLDHNYFCVKCEADFDSDTGFDYHDGIIYEYYSDKIYIGGYYLVNKNTSDLLSGERQLFAIITGCRISDDEYTVKEIIK